jgi:sugar lactone lactonase YvrE
MAWPGALTTARFFCRIATRQIFVFDYDLTRGRLSNRRLFATIPEHCGIPDGAAIDTEGGYLCALHGAGKLRRFKAMGGFDRDIVCHSANPRCAPSRAKT